MNKKEILLESLNRFGNFTNVEDEFSQDQLDAIYEAMKQACNQVLDEAIKSFPSHEHPEIAKSILQIKEEL